MPTYSPITNASSLAPPLAQLLANPDVGLTRTLFPKRLRGLRRLGRAQAPGGGWWARSWESAAARLPAPPLGRFSLASSLLPTLTSRAGAPA